MTSKLAIVHVCGHFDLVSLATNHGGARISFANKWRTIHLSVGYFSSQISNRKRNPYLDRLNGSAKSVALVGAALLLLDFAATAVVSAATATSYLAGEVALPFPHYIGVLLVFVLFTVISLMGLRESARIASGVLAFHVGF